MTATSDQLIEIRRESDIVSARKTGRDVASAIGFQAVDCAKIATAISELTRNILLYAGNGTVLVKAVEAPSGRVGIEVTAEDSGPGIRDIDVVMRDGYSTSKGLGLGLPGTKRLMDEFEVASQQGRGTTVKVSKWLIR